jgi:hypothetical protein
MDSAPPVNQVALLRQAHIASRNRPSNAATHSIIFLYDLYER